MDERFVRNEMILGKDKVAGLANARVAIFGVGGVGGFAAESIARAGVGHILLVDKDDVDVTNINRQIIALSDTVGKPKTDVLKERILNINPNVDIEVRKCFYLPENEHEFDFEAYDYILDCVDTVTAKISLVVKANEAGTHIISAMGAGNKLHPELFEISDIYKTSVCPLAKVMRRELKKRGVKSLKVVYSKEEARIPIVPEGYNAEGKIVGSISFVPGVMGMIMAGQVIRDLTEID